MFEQLNRQIFLTNHTWGGWDEHGSFQPFCWFLLGQLMVSHGHVWSLSAPFEDIDSWPWFHVIWFHMIPFCGNDWMSETAQHFDTYKEFLGKKHPYYHPLTNHLIPEPPSKHQLVYRWFAAQLLPQVEAFPTESALLGHAKPQSWDGSSQWCPVWPDGNAGGFDWPFFGYVWFPGLDFDKSRKKLLNWFWTWCLVIHWQVDASCQFVSWQVSHRNHNSNNNCTWLVVCFVDCCFLAIVVGW